MAKVTVGGRVYDVEVRGETVIVDGQEFPVSVREETGYLTVRAGDQQYRVQLPPESERVPGMAVEVDYRPFTIQWEGSLGVQPAARPQRAAAGAAAAAPRAGVKGGITAQIAGRITSVRVKPGDAVKRGDVLLLLEAMKMENEIKATADGTVKDVLVSEGARVAEGDTLVVVE